MALVRAPAIFAVVVTALTAAAALGTSACDLNRPMPVPRSEPRHACFSAVECPTTMKCLKGPNDVQGVCEPRPSREGDANANGADAGGLFPSPAPRAPTAPLTSPEHPPRPDDLQL